MSTIRRVIRFVRLTPAAIAALLLSVACGHASVAPAPPAFGFHYRVNEGREVRCVLDADLTPEKCAIVAAGVAKINTVVGFRLLRMGEPVRAEDFLEEVTRGDSVTFVAIDTLPANVLGLTGNRGRTVIVLYAPFIWADDALRDSVVLHELLHSIGAGHADQQGDWGSVERPGWVPGAPTDLTPADIASLRAAYPFG